MPNIIIAEKQYQETGEDIGFLNSISIDLKLSWKAKGLFYYLYIHADEDITIEEIIEASKDGPDSFRTALKHLIDREYLHRFNALPKRSNKPNPPPETFYILSQSRLTAYRHLGTIANSITVLDGG